MSIYKHFSVLFLKGIAIGAGSLIPGVSGGTTAILLGVYAQILSSVSDIFKETKKALKILFPLFIGAILSIYILSPIIKISCDAFPTASKYIFAFVSLFSTIIFAKNTLSKKGFHFLFIPLGSLSSFLLAFFMDNNKFNIIYNESFLFLFLIGTILSVALILPAISFSYMMLYFGIYERTLVAISVCDFLYVTPLSLGIVFGSFMFSKILSGLLEKHPEETYSYVLGFVLLSVIELLL